MGDYISRAKAIFALSTITMYKDSIPYNTAVMRIKQLPSAQPEIIRYKDCKHWDGVDTCDVIDAPVWDNDFCSMAERREVTE